MGRFLQGSSLLGSNSMSLRDCNPRSYIWIVNSLSPTAIFDFWELICCDGHGYLSSFTDLTIDKGRGCRSVSNGINYCCGLEGCVFIDRVGRLRRSRFAVIIKPQRSCLRFRQSPRPKIAYETKVLRFCALLEKDWSSSRNSAEKSFSAC